MSQQVTPCIDCENCKNCKKGKPCKITKDCEKCKERSGLVTCIQCKECKGNLCNRGDFKAIKKRLKKGNKRFRRKNDLQPKHSNQSKKRRSCTAINGQKPFAIVLSCADSRVPPELIFDTGIGDLFVVRVAGNIANTSSIASIEFAVAVLGCRYILVLGHEGCGAVSAAIKGEDAGSDNLNQLVGHILPAVNACNCKSSMGEKPCLKKVTEKNVLHSITELNRCSTIIRNTNVKICPAYYNLKTGKVDF